MERAILILILIIISTRDASCAQVAHQVLQSNLAQVLTIEKIIVENIHYNRDEPLPNVRIKESRTPDSNNIYLRLTPMRVQLHTNSNTPVIVSAQFKELKHKEGLYNFAPTSLSVEPTSYTISDPYDHYITEIFTPIVDVKSDTAVGIYRGMMYFTLGGI